MGFKDEKDGVWLYRDEVWLSSGGGLQVVLDLLVEVNNHY